MIGVFLPLIEILSCYNILKQFFDGNTHFDKFTLFSISIPLGIGFSTLIFQITSSLLGFNFIHLIIHYFILTSMFITSLFKKRIINFDLVLRYERNNVYFSLFSAIISFYLIKNTYLYKKATFSETFNGDIHEEISIMNSFYRGINNRLFSSFSLKHPYCHKCKLRTRWLTAAHSAMLRLAFCNVNISFSVPSFYYMFSISFLTMKIAHLLTRNVFLCFCSLLVLLFNGGFGFRDYLYQPSMQNRDLDYVFNTGKYTTEWSHPIYHYFFAFRSTQLAVDISIVMLYLYLKRKEIRNDFLYLILIVLCISLLLPTQFPVFAASLLFFLYTEMIDLYYLTEYNLHLRPKLYSKSMFIFIASSFFSLINLIPNDHTNKLFFVDIYYKPVLEKGKPFPMLYTWVTNLGLNFIIYITIPPFFLRSEHLYVYIFTLIQFYIGNNVSFMIYNRNNIMFFYPYFVVYMSIMVPYCMFKIVNMFDNADVKGSLIGIFIFVYIFCILSGIIGFSNQRKRTSDYWNKGEEKAAKWISRNTPTDSIFITDDHVYDIASVLAGRKTYLQNSRLLWVCGYLEHNERGDLNALLSDLSNKSILPDVKYYINVLSKSKYLKHDFKDWSLVYNYSDILIYERKQLI